MPSGLIGDQPEQISFFNERIEASVGDWRAIGTAMSACGRFS
jgi:hypothetical protein